MSPIGDLDALAPRWLALQAQADASFFQSWTWTGCLARERFSDPVLLSVRDGDAELGLALFNRRRYWAGGEALFLGETGDPGWDSVFIEHNGPLLARGHAAAVTAAIWAALGNGRRLVLSGVPAARPDMPGLLPVTRAVRTAPYADLAALPAAKDAYLATLSANTRHQLRRSARRYGQAGPLAITRAMTVTEGLAFLDALADLHQATWTRRGRPGAFAVPEFRRFHRELVASGLPRGEIDLLRVTAGDKPLGYLYNFRFGGTISAYQSGFDYAAADAQHKPGLTCHHLAIELYRSEGMRRYDFLAGEDRYKTSLGQAAETLHWVELLPRGSARGLLHGLRARFTPR
jgi:CelD/BcsL family acetyltransferase involved in cellulose biosynthesis